MEVILLGTNGWFDTDTGRTISVLVNCERYSLVLDAGFGLARLGDYLPDDRPVYLFLSHFHLDHTVGLHTLARFNFAHGLKIFGQPGTRRALDALLGSPFSIPTARYAFPIEVFDLPAGLDALPFAVTALPLVHADPCFGYRFEIDGRVLAYCTDTGECANAVTLAQGADLLLTECALPPGAVSDGWPHLNPTQAAGIALASGAKRLVLIHFDAANYPTLASRAAAETAARAVFPAATAGRDGLIFTL